MNIKPAAKPEHATLTKHANGHTAEEHPRLPLTDPASGMQTN